MTVRNERIESKNCFELLTCQEEITVVVDEAHHNKPKSDKWQAWDSIIGSTFVGPENSVTAYQSFVKEYAKHAHAWEWPCV